jgi:diphosphomevalonate decarboxylase
VKKSDVLQIIFHDAQREETIWTPQKEKGLAFAPTNIALCKYWGKRDLDLNLPMTSSLSVALPDRGALTTLSVHDKIGDLIILNGQELAADSAFAMRTSEFWDLFRHDKKSYLKIEINMSVPVAAGLASSACGFASLVLALNDYFAWNLSMRHLSILARLGSGSASRSLWNGFVEWHVGAQSDGMDSYGEPLTFEWVDLKVGILSINDQQKEISSRQAMLQTVNTSILYGNWPKKVSRDIVILRQAIHGKNFSLLGGTSESNALTMHATMLSSWPPICYFQPETIAMMHKIWDLRRNGLEVYFTEDAGPNLKLLFLEKDSVKIKEYFPEVEIIRLFE